MFFVTFVASKTSYTFQTKFSEDSMRVFFAGQLNEHGRELSENFQFTAQDLDPFLALFYRI